MATHQTTLSTPLVFISNGAVYSTSNRVAAEFGKQHNNVLRDIRHILTGKQTDLIIDDPIGSADLAQIGQWFIETDYLDESGRTYPSYNLTKDGFVLLAMGFTGAEALRHKVQYIAKYNAMEAVLRSGMTAKPDQREARLMLRERRLTVRDAVRDMPWLSDNSKQALYASVLTPAGIPIPAPVIADREYTTTELAEAHGMYPGPFGKLVKPLKTPGHGENRLTTTARGKQVPQWYWNKIGKGAVDDLLASGRVVSITA